MADVTAIKAQVAALQAQATALDTAITEGKAALEAEIQRVEALIAAGSVSPADLQEIADGLTAASTTLAQGQTDAAAIKTEADAERP
jgi:multidrug resistance efflux pump